MVNTNISLEYIVNNISKRFQVTESFVISIIEKALLIVTKKKFGLVLDILVKLDSKTFCYKTYRFWTVVQDNNIRSPLTEITYSAAVLDNPNIRVGEKVAELVDSVPFSTGVLRLTKDIIIKKINESTKHTLYVKYLKKINYVISGIIKKINADGFVISYEDTIDGFLAKENMLLTDSYKVGDIIKACLISITSLGKYFKLFVSRTCDNMLISLFYDEIPEVTDGVVRIKSIARIPGIRSKIAVETLTQTVDPIGACLGIKSIRLQSIIDELGGEYIDVVLWSNDVVKFIINVFFPLPLMSLVLDDTRKEVDLVVKKENLSQIIGKNGQNIKLSSILVGFELNVINLNTREFYLDTKFLVGDGLSKEETPSYLKDVLKIPDDILLSFEKYGIRTIEELICIPDLELIHKFNLSKDDFKKIRSNGLSYLQQGTIK